MCCALALALALAAPHPLVLLAWPGCMQGLHNHTQGWQRQQRLCVCISCF